MNYNNPYMSNNTPYMPQTGYQARMGAMYNQPQAPQYMPAQTAPTFNNYQAPAQGAYLKGRAVTSLEEARAAMIDLDGSVHIFTDFANGKIYTKQINLDGTAVLNTYTMEAVTAPQAVETPSQVPQIDIADLQKNFVNWSDFDRVLNDISADMQELR